MQTLDFRAAQLRYFSIRAAQVLLGGTSLCSYLFIRDL